MIFFCPYLCIFGLLVLASNFFHFIHSFFPHEHWYHFFATPDDDGDDVIRLHWSCLILFIRFIVLCNQRRTRYFLHSKFD